MQIAVITPLAARSTPAILFVGDENEPVIEPFLPPRTNSGRAIVMVEVCTPNTGGFHGILVHWVKRSRLEQRFEARHVCFTSKKPP